MRTATLIVTAAMLLSAAGVGLAMKITAEGKPLATIVTADEPSPTEQFAAEELRDYLTQISGAELPISHISEAPEGAWILVGSAGEVGGELGGVDPETFIVRVDGDRLVLAGAGDRATLYAVYDFLEQDLGCRWLGPGEVWEEIPQRTSIEIGAIDRTERPGMKYRFLRMTSPGDPGTRNYDCLDWAVKSKINIGSGWPTEELSEQIVKRGGFRAWMSPHVLSNILDPEQNFDEHPEWYALRNNERMQATRGGFQQVCTTNPEVVSAMAAGLSRMLDVRPEVDFMGLGQGDGVAFCECPRCVALDTGEVWPGSDGTGEAGLPVITERWLSFVNEVARGLQRTHPGKNVYTLAYHQTFRPPDPSAIRPEPNVMMQVVNSRPNYVCFVHRFEDLDCPHHVAFREGLERWVDMTPAGVMVYEYDPHSTFCSMPYPAAAKFVDDINYLHRIGVVGYEGQSGPSVWGTYGINHYAIARCTWQTGIEPQALVKEYCDAAFGPASEQMQEFLATVDRAMIAADHITDGVWTWMTPEAMAEARRHLDAAHAAAEAASDKVRARLRTWEISFHYGELGSQAWWKAQRALAEHDAALLAEAIELGNAAIQYVQDEQAKEPHYAGAPGKFPTVHIARWQRTLEAW